MKRSSADSNEQASPVQPLGVTHDWITLQIDRSCARGVALKHVKQILVHYDVPARAIDPRIKHALQWMRANGSGSREAARKFFGDERKHSLLEYHANRRPPDVKDDE
jgi:hypothetical protein